MLSIGEFSKVTQLTIKALRVYHEQALLIPDRIDNESKYRYYNKDSIQKALNIKTLRDLGFALKEIQTILDECNDQNDLIEIIKNKLKEVDKSIKQFRQIKQSLQLFLDNPQEEIMLPTFKIEEEIIPDIIICTIRYKGKYQEIGPKFSTLFRTIGYYANNKPFALYYDSEYKEDDADIEACVEVRKKINITEITCRELKGGNAVTLIHRGPYETLGKSYGNLFEYIRNHKLTVQSPTREVYLKGPNLIFKNNPNKYLTKIMALYEN